MLYMIDFCKKYSENEFNKLTKICFICKANNVYSDDDKIFTCTHCHYNIVFLTDDTIRVHIDIDANNIAFIRFYNNFYELFDKFYRTIKKVNVDLSNLNIQDLINIAGRYKILI
jgi:hypothetical protein